MTKNQLVADDRVWTTRRVRAPLIWKVEKIETKEVGSSLSTSNVARPREVSSPLGDDVPFYRLAA